MPISNENFFLFLFVGVIVLGAISILEELNKLRNPPKDKKEGEQ